MAVCDFTQTVTNQPVSIDTYTEIYKMQYNPGRLQDHFAKFRGLDFFKPEVVRLDSAGLDVSQSIRIQFEEWQNPFDNVNVAPVTYKAGEVCPPIVDKTCPTECANFTPKFKVCDVNLDQQFTIGVTRCVTDPKFTPDSIESLFKRVSDMKAEVMSIRSWAKLICEAVANPSDVVIDTDCFDSHYYDAGSGSIYSALTNGINYLQQAYGSLMNDWVLIIHPDIERNLLAPGSELHNYIQTGIPTAWGNADLFAAGGFKTMPALNSGLWGVNPVVAPNTPSMANGQNPWLSEDGTKVYALFVRNTAYYAGVVALTDEPWRVYPNCPEQKEGWQQTFMDYSKLIRPEEVFVIAFDRACIA